MEHSNEFDIFKILLVMFLLFTETTSHFVNVSNNLQELTETSICKLTGLCEAASENELKLIEKAITTISAKNIDVNPISDKLSPEVLKSMEIDNSYNLCSSKIQLLRPVKVLSEKKTWELVLNNAEFEQAIRVKICKAPEKPCNWPSQPNYKSWCHQEYSSRILYSVRLDGTIFKENFQIPSGCCCYGKWLE